MRQRRLGLGGLRAAVGEDHEPGLEGLFRPGDGGDAGAEGEPFKSFCGGLISLMGWKGTRGVQTMKGDGDEKDNKVTADRDAQGHANEDAVEQDADFQQHALEDALFVELLGCEAAALGLDFQAHLGQVVRRGRISRRCRLDAAAAGRRGARDGRYNSCVAAVSTAHGDRDVLGT